MIDKNNYNPLITALHRFKLSAPVKVLTNKNLLQGDILDFGCGYGSDVKFLKNKHNIYGYDKYNGKFNYKDLLERKYNTLYSSYVFNVIPSLQEFNEALETIKKLSNNIYIAVRSDIKAIKKHWIYDEQIDGYWTKNSFQRFFNEKKISRYFKNVDYIEKNSNFILFKLKTIKIEK